MIKHARHIFWEIHEVRKGLWAFFSWFCFSGADWLSKQTPITWRFLWKRKRRHEGIAACQSHYNNLVWRWSTDTSTFPRKVRSRIDDRKRIKSDERARPSLVSAVNNYSPQCRWIAVDIYSCKRCVVWLSCTYMCAWVCVSGWGGGVGGRASARARVCACLCVHAFLCACVRVRVWAVFLTASSKSRSVSCL